MNPSKPLLDTAPTYTTRTTCRLCGGQWLVQFMDLGALCLSDFVLPSEPDPPQVPLRLAMCSACNLVQLMDTTDPELLYRRFWYRSGTNLTMRDEMRRLSALASDLGRSGPGTVWLDIGANDGTLLSCAPAGTRRIGVEPALNLREPLSEHCDQVISDYFHANQVEGVDTIFSAAMFYDLDQPSEFCHEISRALKPGGIWINQLSYTPLMLDKLAFDNVCHEHLAYYNLETLEKLYNQCGLKILDVALNAVNGGSMCVVATHAADPRDEMNSVHDLRHTELSADYNLAAYTRFARDVRAWKDRATAALDYLTDFTSSDVHVYGASTKGNTLLQYIDANTDWLPFASERNPEKIGRVTVGSRIPIISEEESRAMRPGAYLVLPWAFREEFIARESAFLKAGGKLIFPLPDWEVIGA
jgi:hypothetical protein